MDGGNVVQVKPGIWEVAQTAKKGMRVPARIVASEKIFDSLESGVFEQITNVACLPGIVDFAYAMPDAHWGYGFPIGGVAAFDLEKGIVSPGGIGFDINCGMRLLTTTLKVGQVRPKIEKLVDKLFAMVPAGVGRESQLHLGRGEFEKVLVDGPQWAVSKGYGVEQDVVYTEDGGQLANADPSKCSKRAFQRGVVQLGTLGSGNHYLEIQVVEDEDIFDKDLAEKMGIFGGGQICVMIHCGSRGFGHQVASDYLQVMNKAALKYGFNLPDRQLACAPIKSPEGRDYLSAMACAANYAFCNRQIITDSVRRAFEQVMETKWQEIGLEVVYDVAHNIAKFEQFGGKKLLVHRKGATRAFGPGRKELPEKYLESGQPVILGGSMETGSYLLVGTKKAEEMTFGSTAHGSGRIMSRRQAKRQFRGDKLQKELGLQGIYIRTVSYSGLAEEAGGAYKNIEEVVNSLELVGISKRVARFRPIGNIKG